MKLDYSSFLLGMSAQAFIVSYLASRNLITLNAGQQFAAGFAFLGIFMLSKSIQWILAV